VENKKYEKLYATLNYINKVNNYSSKKADNQIKKVSNQDANDTLLNSKQNCDFDDYKDKISELILEIEANDETKEELQKNKRNLDLETKSSINKDYHKIEEYEREPSMAYEVRDQWAARIIFTNKKYVLYVLGFILIVGNTYFIYNSSIVDTSNIGFESIQFSGIALGSIELLCYLVCLPIASKMKRRSTTIYCCLAIFLGGLTVFFINLFSDHSDKFKKIAAWTSVILCKGGASIMYTYINNYMAEVFPTKIRGSAVGIICAFARFLGASTAFIKTAIAVTQFDLIVPCSALSLVIIPIVFFMPETLDKQLD